MHVDTEDAANVHEDFCNALALLHSTEDDSTEKLRKMLDALIERRYGVGKTLTVRLPKKFPRNTKTRDRSFLNEKSEKPGDVVSRKTGSTSKRAADRPFVTNNPIEGDWKPVNVFDMDVEDYSEKADIPRISIPDEGSADGLLCKVCNGAKLGPLILLECQECQDVYHPLCHQPPVVDIDVYDPRIVWTCRKCVDTSVAFVTDYDETERKIAPLNTAQEIRANTDTFEESDSGPSRNDTTVAVQALLDCEVEDALITKAISTQRLSRNLTSSQLRKRIGSKLSVTRPVVK